MRSFENILQIFFHILNEFELNQPSHSHFNNNIRFKSLIKRR